MNKRNLALRDRFKAAISNRDGFSLVEVMVATGIGTIVSAGIAAVFIFAIEQFTVLVEQNAAEESLLWAAYNTRSFLSQAIDLEVHAADLTSSIPAGQKGQVLSSYTSASDGTIKTLAIFNREMSTAAGATGSNLFSTGVFFINPTTTPVAGNQQPWGGVLIFDMGSNTDNPMWPSLSDLWFDRISEFRIQDVECALPGQSGAGCEGSNAKSATVVIKARYFKNAKREQWIYAPTIPAGTVIAPYRDIEMTVKVGFRDNVLLNSAGSRVGSTTDERLHGGLYFFRMILPPLRM